MAADDERREDAEARELGTPEDREREAARRRAEHRERARALGEEPERTALTDQARAVIPGRAFAALADNVRDYAIFLMDPNGIITFWGEGARLIKWWTKDAAEGGHLRMLYPPGGSNDGTAEEHLKQAAERGEYTGEGQRMRSDGSLFWGGITLTALWSEDGTLTGFAKTTRDITARRAADALLQSAAVASEEARAAAVAANAAKSGFLATMSHEIRTPINAVMGYLDLLSLEMDGPLTPGQRSHIARATTSARHLLSLISEVLDFSRIEADQVAVERTAFRIGDAVGDAMGLVTPQARARGVQISDAVGGYAAGLAVWGDEPRTRQILVNLLDNAIKFTESRGGGAPGRITVSAGAATQASPEAKLSGDGPWVYVRVEDTGTGIPADRLQPIFEAFIQADMTLTRRHGGTGLGLAICRRLARLMGGDVTARSDVGVGSTFFLWLPAAPVESLQTGGLRGHGPGGEAPGPPAVRMDPTRERDAGGENGSGAASESSGTPFRAAADAVLAEMERVLHAYVARLRSDSATPSAHAVSEALVEDHLASFLADVAVSMNELDAHGAVPPGDPTPELLDATAIQRVVSERHGLQRFRLGWSEQELHREFTILREELEAAVLRRAPDYMKGPTPEARRREAERVLETLRNFLVIAERLSIASYHQAPSSTGGNT